MHRTNQHPGARALGDAHTHTHAQFDAEQSRAEDAEHGQIVPSDAKDAQASMDHKFKLEAQAQARSPSSGASPNPTSRLKTPGSSSRISVEAPDPSQGSSA